MNVPLSPAELLDTRVVLTPWEVAHVLGWCYTRGARRGEPSRERARAEIRRGTLPLVDPRQPAGRWTVSTVDVRRYLAGEPFGPFELPHVGAAA